MKKIILADDTPTVRMVSVMALELIGGFVVTACDDGIQVIAKAHQIRPDMILLDWSMPRLNGRETLEKLKIDPRTRDIPVAVVTGVRRPQDIADMLRLGAVDVIEKPFDVVSLPDRLRRSWGEAVGRAHPGRHHPQPLPGELGNDLRPVSHAERPSVSVIRRLGLFLSDQVNAAKRRSLGMRI